MSVRPADVVPGLIVSALLATAAFMLADTPVMRDTLRVGPLLLVTAGNAEAAIPPELVSGGKVARL